MEKHLGRQANAALRILKKHDAPDPLIIQFQELLEINANLECKASVRELLIDACRQYNFTAPFSMDGKKRHFRARLLDETHPQRAPDCADRYTQGVNLGAEQSYRRGCDHGFALAMKEVRNGATLDELKKQQVKIHAWRTRPLQIVGSAPGSDESFSDCFVLPKGSVSARTRFKIFERDSFRCQVCGRSQTDGVQLHVDHKKSVADGGNDDMHNLQTLCSDCNLGKSSDSMN